MYEVISKMDPVLGGYFTKDKTMMIGNFYNEIFYIMLKLVN